jgi:hypothetical protein
MKYKSWLTYPNLSIGVLLKKDEFHCSEFEPNQEKKQKLKICSTIVELKFYLLSFPMPPKKEILILIEQLESENGIKQNTPV